MNTWYEYVLLSFLVVSSFIVGISLAACTDTYKTGSKAVELINKCEATLPRDQHCVLQAVPQAKGE